MDKRQNNSAAGLKSHRVTLIVVIGDCFYFYIDQSRTLEVARRQQELRYSTPVTQAPLYNII